MGTGLATDAVRTAARTRGGLEGDVLHSDDMAEAVQDGGERSVQDGTDRLEAVTALASRRSASTIAGAAVSRRARAIHPTVDRVPSRHPPVRTGRVHRSDWLPSRAPTGQVIG
ncbi:hypothetical protein ACFVFI_34435 [Streptomyces sp. NPDC057705]|uniref:hypothetical protein n=1 Tax=Streptomyces sp. NPDC057705 TaxID=3346222 RepID=UPI0036AE6591